MKNSDGLTHKQFLFCEELLRNGFIVCDAFKKAYPNDQNPCNGFRQLKRKEVVAYIQKRQKQQEHTMDTLMAAAHERLSKIIANGSDKDAAKAIEILKNTNDKIKNLQVPITEETKSISIHIETASSEQQNSNA